MSKSPFNLAWQNADLPSKITAGLERMSGVFRTLLWEYAKTIGLSPIQIQVLIFVASHDDALCNVSYLAREFNVTKPTISDALKVLEKKGLISKISSADDKRAYTIALTESGKDIVNETESFANPVKKLVEELSNEEQEHLFNSLKKMIFGLNQAGIINVQRICFGCRFYEKKKVNHFCHFLNAELADSDIRLNCPEFEEKAKNSDR